MTECRKVAFVDKELAEQSMEEIRILNMVHGREKKNKRIHVYRCPRCQFWHVGHDTPAKFRNS